MVVPDDTYGAILHHFTGNKDHNILLRLLAKKKGLMLNEFGLFKGKKRIASRTEEEIYAGLGLPFIEPELRTGGGEIEAAVAGTLPKLIPYGAIRGDLQVQTSWTDGAASIEKMAEAAKKLGLDYMAVTDHTKALAMTGGLDEKALAKQGKEIDALNRKHANFTILKGSECDILKDGSMDLNDAALASLDFVGASIHSFFKLTGKEQTARMITAMKNPHVDAIFHPTGRKINKRPPYDIDILEVLKAAKATGTLMEIDAYPDRSDLRDEHVRMAVKLGVKLLIDTDAHHPSHLEWMDLGVAIARRGWAEKKDVLNTRPLKDLLKWLQTPKPQRR
jgi:DNA polymerase (family 10)